MSDWPSEQAMACKAILEWFDSTIALQSRVWQYHHGFNPKLPKEYRACNVKREALWTRVREILLKAPIDQDALQ